MTSRRTREASLTSGTRWHWSVDLDERAGHQVVYHLDTKRVRARTKALEGRLGVPVHIDGGRVRDR